MKITKEYHNFVLDRTRKSSGVGGLAIGMFTASMIAHMFDYRIGLFLGGLMMAYFMLTER